MDQPCYHTKESAAEYIQLAKSVNGAKLITILQRHLSAGSMIHELGSGPGSDCELLQAHFKVTGSDFSNIFLSHLKNKYPEDQFLKLNAATLYTDKKFDGIYSNKVLHHLNEDDLKSSIKRQHEILNPNGIICHSFWKGEGDEIFKGMYVKYHTENALEKFFGDHFEILVLDAYAEFEADDSLLLIGRKKG
ncbi:MAG: class I SAM-dependent methyltransferase [Saprospiraceae bacterium]|nr:class I SAM-dependent methyltransferase [Saprospiraceae bacterium]